MAKIGFFEIEGWEEKNVRAEFPNDELFFTKEKLHEFDATQKNDFDIVSVFVNSEVTEETLSKFPSVKCVATRSTGFDHIDIEVCKKRGIRVAFVPGYGNNTVAEFAFGLLLNLTRKIYQAVDRVKESGVFSYEGLRGVDLKEKTMGIIGTGRIGKEAIRISKGFGMHVVAFDLHPDVASATELGFEYKTLEDLLRISDFVSIHAPYNESTHHLINSDNIMYMKRGSYIVNTARGGIIETAALIRGLEEGILAGVGLDVLEEEGEVKDEMKFFKEKKKSTIWEEMNTKTSGELETIIQNHMLMRMPNVLITPHNAFNTQEALERILKTTTDNIHIFLNGSDAPKSFVV